ncbi:MAG: hypothetical protein H6709_17545 [Kofleriaceae bacterium]|nr:hypothetical protein [Kofleriaceae bacterium]
MWMAGLAALALAGCASDEPTTAVTYVNVLTLEDCLPDVSMVALAEPCDPWLGGGPECRPPSLDQVLDEVPPEGRTIGFLPRPGCDSHGCCLVSLDSWENARPRTFTHPHVPTLPGPTYERSFQR